MIIIKNNEAGLHRFPLAKLLDELGQHFSLTGKDVIHVTRIGGNGEKIWAIESALDNGASFTITFDDLKILAASSDELLDELACIHDSVVFGISDSSFMFVQSPDKAAEHRTAIAFDDVVERSDHDFR